MSASAPAFIPASTATSSTAPAAPVPTAASIPNAPPLLPPSIVKGVLNPNKKENGGGGPSGPSDGGSSNNSGGSGHILFIELHFICSVTLICCYIVSFILPTRSSIR